MARERDPLVIGRVIGDVVDRFRKSVSLTVIHGGREVTSGCQLKPSDVVRSPTVQVGGDDPRSLYTLVSDQPSSHICFHTRT